MSDINVSQLDEVRCFRFPENHTELLWVSLLYIGLAEIFKLHKCKIVLFKKFLSNF